MGRALLLVAIVMAAVLGWGYWHVASHASVYVAIHDVALKNDRQASGRVLGADVAFLDAAGAVLARGSAAGPPGVVAIVHPELGDCTAYERQALVDKHARTAWQGCVETMSRWSVSWVKEVRYATVTLADCRIDRTPVLLGEYREAWWLWWVPLPHVGGPPYTYYDLSVKVDGAHCRAVAP